MSALSTIFEEAETAIEIKRSKFISRSFKTEDPKSALVTLKKVREAYRDASHNCWAYRIGITGEHSRCSDDGEPHGTAGLPILDTLIKNNVTNTLLVVTRYYGGIKLGTGGLARAYNEAAKSVLDESRLTQLQRVLELQITIPYPSLTPLENYLKQIKGEVITQSYADNVKLAVVIPVQEEDNFRLFYANLVKGRFNILRGSEKYV